MNNYNASLQNNLNNVEMSQGTATFLLKTLSGYKFEIVNINGKDFIVWNKDNVNMGGMQPLDTFLRSVEMAGNASNLSRALEIATIKADIAAAQSGLKYYNLQRQGNTTEAVYEAFENASPADVNNCTQESARFADLTGNMTIENTRRAVFKASMLDTERVKADVAKQIKDNWSSLVK